MNEQVPPAPSSKTSGLAIASLVLGVLGLVCLLPIVSPILAVIFGIAAIKDIAKSEGLTRGRGQAIAGLILGALSLLLNLAMILPAIAGAREKDHRAQCWNNMKQIGLAIGMYADARDGNIPRTFDDLRPYATNLDKLLICPSAKDTSHPSYQIMLGGGKWERYGDNPDAVVVIESPSNHLSGRFALYNDGHVSYVFNQPTEH